MIQCSGRSYIRSADIINLAVQKYTSNGNGITYNDLIIAGLARHKNDAQRKLKYLLLQEKLFALQNRKPQRYYPTSIKSKILENLKRRGNVPVVGTGMVYSDMINSLDEQKINSLREILDSLCHVPLQIHKIRLHTTIDEAYYQEIDQIPRDKNNAKVFEENIGTAHAQYVYSPNGKVEVPISCSRSPYRIEMEGDESILFAFFGQIRDRMIFHLHDDRELIVKPLMNWTLVQCDLNRDVEVGDSMQLSFPSIQLKHVDRVFCLYIKSLGAKTVCRCEELVDPMLSISEALKNIRNGRRE